MCQNQSVKRARRHTGDEDAIKEGVDGQAFKRVDRIRLSLCCEVLRRGREKERVVGGVRVDCVME